MGAKGPPLWMLSLRNVRSDPKLHSASQGAWRGPGSSKGAQARSKGGLKGRQRLPCIVAPGLPQKLPKGEA